MTWIVMPVMAEMDMTRAAIGDCLAQSVPTKLLIINQGCPDSMRDELERIAEEYDDRVLCWAHQPPLPSLAATWNRALDFVWEAGGTEALVVNNDVRLAPYTLGGLLGALNVSRNLFVSAVGVTPDQFTPEAEHSMYWYDEAKREVVSKGGPDFSCFLISRECHLRFRFDEAFTPAFCEDLDYHRRLMLAGEGARIFSVNLPYLHYGSATLKTSPNRSAIEAAITQGSRAHYRAKWGGEPNHETFYYPFGELTVLIEGDTSRDYPIPPCGSTTPELQAWVQGTGNGSPS